MKTILILLCGAALVLLLATCAKINVFDEPADHPVIDSIHPASGIVGTRLRLYGKGFSTYTSLNRVTINGVALVVDSPSTSTVLLAHLTDSTGTGKVHLVVQDKEGDGPIFTYLGGGGNGPLSLPVIVGVERGWNDARGYTISVKHLSKNDASIHFKVNGTTIPIETIVRSGDTTHPDLLRFQEDASLENNGNTNLDELVVTGDGLESNSFLYQIPPREILTGALQYHPGDTVTITGLFFGSRTAVSQVSITYGGAVLSPLLSIITWTNTLITAKLPTYPSIVADAGQVGKALVRPGLQVGVLHADAPLFYYLLPTVVAVGTVSTLAGGLTAGYLDGQGTAAQFGGVRGLVVDGQGNIFVCDRQNHRIRKITPGGLVSTVAGSGVYGYRDGPAATAQFKFPEGIAIDPQGNLYTSELSSHCIRKITPSGNVSTFAGDTASGYADGQGHAARFNFISSLVSDANGTLYVTDQGNIRIRKILSDGTVSTYAGSGIDYGTTDGPAASASFGVLAGITLDAQNNMYVSEYYPDNRIRKITPGGIVSTFAGADATGYVDGVGSAARFNHPYGLATDAGGNLYVTDVQNNRIRKIAPDGTVTTLAGTGAAYSIDGSLTAASFNLPIDLATDPQGNIYVSDGVAIIRKITLH